MRRYSGDCHCGEITFTFHSQQIVEGMRCNCSICKRKGAAVTNFTIPPENLEIFDEKGLLSSYQFDDGIAKHYFCSQCGIATFVETRLNPGEYRVNLGCIDEIDSYSLPITVFDGKNL